MQAARFDIMRVPAYVPVRRCRCLIQDDWRQAGEASGDRSNVIVRLLWARHDRRPLVIQPNPRTSHEISQVVFLPILFL